jgi:hypothetical protein
VWWNPFASGQDLRDTSAQLASSSHTQQQSTDNDNEEHPRKLQERKDTTLLLLALEFRQASLDHDLSVWDPQEREQLVDMAFDRIQADGMDVDNKTILQLRHALQAALEPQVVDLFRLFRTIDEELMHFLDEEKGRTQEGIHSTSDSEFASVEAYCKSILQLELEKTIDELANPSPRKAPRQASDPKEFLTLKRGAIERLLAYDSEQNSDPQEDDASPHNVSWVDADEFGYHASSVDHERNRLMRYHQSINICRAAVMKDVWGFSVLALQSSIPGAGRGVYVDGYAKAGSVVAFQPGPVWAKEHMLNVTADEERQLERNDAYQMSLRPDDYMIDSRKSPYTVLTDENSNLMAVGHIVNHPTPSHPPNARSAMLDFTQGMELADSNLKRYIPNTYARPRNLSALGGLWDRDVVEMHSMVLVATRDICNEEVFYDYRLATSHYPQWYHPVKDNAFDAES